MSHTDDTNPSRGRPVLKRLDPSGLPTGEVLEELAKAGLVWMFCGEYDVSTAERAADAAHDNGSSAVYKVFPSGSWPGGYLRD